MPRRKRAAVEAVPPIHANAGGARAAVQRLMTRVCMMRELSDPRNRLGAYMCGCRACWPQGWCIGQTYGGMLCDRQVARSGEARGHGYCKLHYEASGEPLAYTDSEAQAAIAKIMADYEAGRAAFNERAQAKAQAARQRGRQQNETGLR